MDGELKITAEFPEGDIQIEQFKNKAQDDDAAEGSVAPDEVSAEIRYAETGREASTNAPTTNIPFTTAQPALVMEILPGGIDFRSQ